MDKSLTVSVRWVVAAALAALALVAAYVLGHAGTSPARADTTSTPRTVTVTGTGHVQVVPDQLAFDLSVSVVRPDLSQSLADANTSVQSVVDTLTVAGVDAKNVQTTNVSMYPEYDRPQKKQPPVLRGYRVSHSLSVTVDDLDKGSSVVTAVLAAGAQGVRLDGLRLQVKDPDGSLEPARSDALDQAAAKAKEYADKSGLELGDIVRISETSDQPFGYEAQAGMAADSVAASVPIQAGQQDLSTDVVVVYELR